MKYPTIDTAVFNYIPNLHPFIDYVFEDKSHYPTATSAGFKDEDNDFLIGDSSYFLMNIDFIFVNTNQFTEVADNFRRSCSSAIKDDGYYINAKPGTIEYNNFWKRETKRRRKGMVAKAKLFIKDIYAYNACTTDNERSQYVHDVRITGDHYNYLNYGRINRTPDPHEKAELLRLGRYKQKVITSFPRFWDGDYWNFKVDEFVAKNNYHLAKGKARRKGYSNKRGSQGANTINLNPGISIVFAAFDIKYLTDSGATTDMLKRNLDWYENKTYWRRGYLSEDLTNIELGFKIKTEANKKFGFRSKAISVTCQNNPDAVIGKQAVEIDFEEAGKFPNLQQALDVTFSATEDGLESVGTVRIYGTGGTKGANWAPFSNAFLNPASNDMMPFENIWDKSSRHLSCGFFHPQIQNMAPYMDVHGNSMLVDAYLIDREKKDRAKKSKTAEEYSIYCSQRANSPAEAFNIETDNIFSSTELNDHIKWVRLNENMIHYRDGQFISEGSPDNNYKISFQTNDQLQSKGEKVHDYIKNVPFTSKDDVYGCWRIYHEPLRTNGEIPDNLYYMVIDSVGKDKTIKEVTTKNSLNAIYILSYPNTLGVPADTICAVYIGRRDDSLTSCSEESLKGCIYFNAKALPETDRGSVVPDFKRWKNSHRLLKNPIQAALTTKVRDSIVNEYGIYIGEGDNAVDAIINLKSWLYEKVNVNVDGTYVYRLHYILDLPTLIELQKFSSTGNFDRVSALRLAPFQRAAYIAKKQKATTKDTTRGSIISNIGLYGSRN